MIAATSGPLARLALATLVGAVSVTAFAPYGIWPAAMVCPAVLMALWQGARPRLSFWLGFAYGVGTFGAGTWWLFLSIHGYGLVPIPLALLLVAAVVALMSLWYALCGWLAARWLPANGVARWLFGLPALWLCCEWARGWIISGFPWLSLGYSQSDSWLIGWAPLLGVYGISFWLLVSAGALLALWRATLWQRVLAAVALLLAWLPAVLLRHVEWNQPAGATVSAALVQGAVSQDQKWLSDNRLPTRALYAGLNRQALGAQLVLWPESALPELANLMPDYYAQRLTEAQAAGSTLLIGAPIEITDGQDELYNSLVVLGAGEPQRYDKRHLVPFGEYFPVPDRVRAWMRMMNLPFTTDFSVGAPDQPPLRAAGLSVAPTICYEDAFGTEQRRLVGASELLVNVTNDAWFGHSAARHQHFQIARLRAAESRRFLLRAANDGISAIVGPYGEVQQRAPEFVAVVLRGTVTPRRGLTPYVRAGNAPVLILAVVALLAAVGVAWRQRRIQRIT